MDTRILLSDKDIELLDIDLNKYINNLYNYIKIDFSELIKTDEEWMNLQDKNIFLNFKKQYFSDDFSLYDDFILFTCLKYDINRLKNVLYSNNKIINSFFYRDSLRLNHLSFFHLFNKINNIKEFNTISQLNKYIRARIILPAYSVLIPYWFEIIKNLNIDYIHQWIGSYFCGYRFKINNFKYSKWLVFDIDNKPLYKIQTSSTIDKEYINNMKNSVLSIQNIIEQQFINKPNKDLLWLLLNNAIKKINEHTSSHIIKFFKKEVCPLIFYNKVNKLCLLNNEQKTFINSLRVLNSI